VRADQWRRFGLATLFGSHLVWNIGTAQRLQPPWRTSRFRKRRTARWWIGWKRLPRSNIAG